MRPVAVRTTGLVAQFSQATRLRSKSCSTPTWDQGASCIEPRVIDAGPPCRRRPPGAWNASRLQGNGASDSLVEALLTARLWEPSLQLGLVGEASARFTHSFACRPRRGSSA